MRPKRINLDETLPQRGYRCTSPRREVLGVFSRNHLPLTAAEVYSRTSMKGINLASVYRTIQLFCELGILESIDRVEQGQRFHLTDDYRSHHHHLVCQTCGRTQDFEECTIDQLVQRIFDRTKFKVLKHELRFVGVCSSCA